MEELLESKDIPFEAYARLITMLSEQLIKNETVALTELVKNSYDADSDWVKISFINFTKDYKSKSNSRIVIEDCGDGMSHQILTNDFINPASANKKFIKQDGNKTKKGRILQGEKGIGRFSLFKLGKKVTVYTKTQADLYARKLVVDLTQYNSDFTSDNNEQLMLNNIKAKYFPNIEDITFLENVFIDNDQKKRLGKGTIIEIENLNDSWGKRKFTTLMDELYTLLGNSDNQKFSIYVYKDNSFLAEEIIDNKSVLKNILDQKSVFKINGEYIENERRFKFILNNKEEYISLDDKKIQGLYSYRTSFKEKIEDLKENELDHFNTECGSFSFKYYVFDLDTDGLKGKYKLDEKQQEIVKSNRVYVYRDGIRVFPYGSKKDDWLQVDTIRGLLRASSMFSNDQLVGFINITHNDNAKLMDKTNREGLIEYGTAYSDFVAINQIFLQYIKQYYYIEHQKQKEVIKKFEKNDSEKVFKEFEQIINETKDEKMKKKIETLYAKVDQQNTYNLSRIKVVENLAGIGLSISATHHDLMNFIRRCYNLLDSMYNQLLNADEEYISKHGIIEKTERLRGLVSSMESLLNDMQSLFAASNQTVSNIKVSSMIDRVLGYYSNLLESKNIKFEIKNVGISPLVVKMPEASLLTIFINLFDNAIYWLENIGGPNKKIKLTLNAEENYLLFSDSGPGIEDDEKEKIFEAFYTGKGIEGRGLGLYISRQFLERFDYSIYVENKNNYSLSGANFVLDFNKITKED